MTCREDQADTISSDDGVSEWQPLADEDGAEIAGEENDRAFTAFSLNLTAGDGDEVPVAVCIECRTLVPEEAVLLVTLLAPADAYEEDAAAALEVLDTIELAAVEDEEEA